MSLGEVWNLLQKSKEVYQLQDKSPERPGFQFGYEAPQNFTRETITHEVFQFCHKYLEKYHSNFKVSKQRHQIRTQLSNTYGEQIFQNLLGKSSISCYSNVDRQTDSLRIDFFSDRNLFKPYKWDYVSKDGVIFYSEEDESKSGRKESFTTFSSDSCKKESKKDRNGYGDIDEWWIYENCNLIKIEYDENENGYRERTCFFDAGKLSYCQGVGEKEEKDARLALSIGNNETALRLFKLAHEEIKKESPKPSFKSCLLLREIISLDFQKKDYPSFAQSLDEFLSIPQCEKASLDMLIYKGYYQLYLSKEYKAAKISYRKAAFEYYKENGEENPELVLNLSLAEYLDQDPLACLASLERLRERRMLYHARFYFFYYRASCNQLLSKHNESLDDLKKALAKSIDDEYHSLIHFKMANAYFHLDQKDEGIPYLVQALNKDLSLIQFLLNDPLYHDFLKSNVGKNLSSKYYLNQKQK